MSVGRVGGGGFRHTAQPHNMRSTNHTHDPGLVVGGVGACRKGEARGSYLRTRIDDGKGVIIIFFL